MQAYILVNCDTGRETEIISELKKIPEVVEINGVWGKYDIFLKVSTNDPNGIDKVVRDLRSRKGITDTYTMYVLYGQGGTIDNE